MKIRTYVAGALAAAAVSVGTIGAASAAENPAGQAGQAGHPRLEQLCERLPQIEQRVQNLETRLNEATTRLQAARAKAEAAGRTDLVNRIDQILGRVGNAQQKLADFKANRLAKLEAACAKQ